jgi:hypothetical protein
MDVLGPATEEDMILAFVRAERDSRARGAWHAERLQTNDPVQLLAAIS